MSKFWSSFGEGMLFFSLLCGGVLLLWYISCYAVPGVVKFVKRRKKHE